jgi:GNAT superfamily N-acetyltransferase
MATTLRPLGAQDLERICAQRTEMFLEAGWDAGKVAAMAAPFAAWLAPRLADGRYFGFMAECDGAVVAGVGLMLLDWPPHPAHPDTAARGYVLNVYVDPGQRRQGLAQTLMAEAEREFARRGIGFAILHATAAGKPLYAGLGWNATSEMSKPIPTL